jgi:hypothetical protein
MLLRVTDKLAEAYRRQAEAVNRASALEVQLQAAIAKWQDYEKNYILPTFGWAEKLDPKVELEQLVRDNPGKNCVELLFKHMLARISDLQLYKDAHEDASIPAFDEIVEICGLAKTWEYPGQVIRDVKDSIERRNAKIAELEKELAGWKEECLRARAAERAATGSNGKESSDG